MRFFINKERITLIGILSILWMFSGLSYSESKIPKLVIIITVDQLRADYLLRYDMAFSGGFRRLRDEGWRYDRGIVDHAPTLSWPGHTTIATGAHPKTHSISTNARIVDKVKRQMLLFDAEAHILGFPRALSLSSRNIRVTGIADWFQTADSESRTVALSTGPGLALCYGGKPHKDRTRNHVYWLDASAGQFVTTTFYRDDYPEWIEKFNSDTLPAYKKNLVWENSVPPKFRSLARADDTAYEGDGIHTTFPHRIEHGFKTVSERAINNWFYNYSPYAEVALFALAQEAVKELELGQRSAQDFLAIAIKSTDRIGHDYGPLSLEQMDNILRIDRELGKFFFFLDEAVGVRNYMLALTSDHGAPNIVEYEIEQGRNAKRVSEAEIKELLAGIEKFIDNYSGPQKKLPAFLVISYALFLLPYFLTRTGAYSIFPHLLGAFTPFYFTLGPLLLIYVKLMTYPRFVFSTKYLLHFIPFGLSILTWVPFYFHSGSYKLYLFTNGLIRSPFETNLIRGIRLVYLLVYLIWVYLLVKKHKIKIKECFSSIERIKLKWIQLLAVLMASDVVGYFVMTILGAAHPELYAARKSIFGIWKSVVIFYIGYKGLTQPVIFPGREERGEKEKYSTSRLTPAQSEVFLKKLKEHMNIEKPFLESELNLTELAEQTDIPQRFLSQVINDKLNQNFFDFVNRYRVKEAKKLLLQPNNPKDTILDIAFDCGFNSKSSFNFVFKKYSLLTPSQFREKHKKEEKGKAEL